MRFLITGGAGFIGAALANALVREGHHVRVLDDLSAGDPGRLSPEVSFSRGDVRDMPKLWTLLQDVHGIFHLAARVSVPESILYPREYNDVNVGGTVSVMAAMRDVGVRRVVFASSGTIFGEQPRQPVNEDARPNPLAPYAVSKMAAEHYIFALGALYGIETVALRIFNAYGPGQAIPPFHAPVVPQILKQTLGGGSVVIFGDGSQTRDFVHIDDVVCALIAAMTAPGVNRQIVNVGSGDETSVDDLVRLIARVVGHTPEIIHNEAQSGGVNRLVADTQKAEKLLGFRSRVGLEEGLRRLLAQDPQFGAERPKSRGNMRR